MVDCASDGGMYVCVSISSLPAYVQVIKDMVSVLIDGRSTRVLGLVMGWIRLISTRALAGPQNLGVPEGH